MDRRRSCKIIVKKCMCCDYPTNAERYSKSSELNKKNNRNSSKTISNSVSSFTAPASQDSLKDIEIKQVNGVEPSPILPAPIPGTVPSQPNCQSNENGLPIAATAEEVKERCPPKAMVKPQVLTHVIEDFVIQESSEPFPVTRSSLLGDLKPTQSSNDKDDEPPRK